MFACVPNTALCRTTSILNIPNVPSKSQQMAGQDDSGATVTHMYEMQANKGRGHERGQENAHLMFSTGIWCVCLECAAAGILHRSAVGCPPQAAAAGYRTTARGAMGSTAFPPTENE